MTYILLVVPQGHFAFQCNELFVVPQGHCAFQHNELSAVPLGHCACEFKYRISPCIMRCFFLVIHVTKRHLVVYMDVEFNTIF